MDKINAEWAKDIPCRNITIYGYCKKIKDGCPFKHGDDVENENLIESTTPKPQTTTIADIIPTLPRLSNTIVTPTPSPVPKFNAKNSASFTPMSTKTPELNNTPIFDNNPIVSSPILTAGTIPLTNVNNTNTIAPVHSTHDSNNIQDDIQMKSASKSPSTIINPLAQSSYLPISTNDQYNSVESSNQAATQSPIMNNSNNLSQNINAMPHSSFPLAQTGKTLLHGDPNLPSTGILNSQQMLLSNYQSILPQSENTIPEIDFKYPSIYPPPHSILQYHLYAPDPPPQLKLPLKPNERTPESLFISNNLREQLVKRNLASLQVFPAGGAIPDIVQDYFGLVPLDFHQKSNSKDYIDFYSGHKNSLFKVFSNLDGKLYLLRRIHDVTINDPQQITKSFSKWNELACNSIIKLKDMFTTLKFGDSSLCLVYDYYPLAISLYEYHFINFPLIPLTQDYLWTYLVQLTNAINVAHSKGLTLGKELLNWDKILIVGDPGRIKISSCGAYDVLTQRTDTSTIPNNSNNNNNNIINMEEQLQIQKQNDFSQLGIFLQKLSCKINGVDNTSNVEKIDDLNVDDQFKTVLKYLLDKSNKNKNIKELSQLFIDKILSNLESFQGYAEFTEATLSKELENARLFRLICKLNFIFGRIESRIDINWSESGEKFPIILFYDYVFHQLDSNGKPIMDLTHVLRCLNKLDAGIQEKIVLVTPDELNCIVITYKELRDLIDSTFRSLSQ
ncbi:PAN-complex poly(A)-binding subunit PAN3 NDAI_0C00120 [Naumovozyma dairenensis CBS 421]|uniref:PAN2-PAN3 deadenylation complex subunit PAN3 n=1 Tax=Naumovozyma dairenensis (strain ATCC 10597 / BCRC 20456 / CBS 421 / NBRC 0211 / NRRL Y-12639) TaxID=1071378 RepID=G0W7B1_NAUDC|nr:hypothetical protein NDAI_0C00120 [Naumovozyma dairenensis CBS 421]CCD23672.1 hypothetical protein NDAI_0C00120 [Naumovozyma dairenensis CBS 421]